MYLLAFSIIECMLGHTGENCSSLCPYPYYGVDCQRPCNCSRDLCNVSTGCIDGLIGNHIFFHFFFNDPPPKKKEEKKMYYFGSYFNIKNDCHFS